MKNRVIVTGANGFIGNYVTKELIKNGAEVLAMNGKGLDVKNNDVKNCVVDILNIDDIKNAFKDFKPDCILHLAAIAAPTFGNVAMLYDINVHGSENILEAAKGVCSEGTRVVLTSTAGVYGNSGKDFITEETGYNPQNHYSYSKMVMEYISKNYRDILDIKIIRPFNMIGTGQTTKFLVPKLVEAFVTKQPVLKVGNLETQRDYVDVEFASKIFAKFATEDNSKYNVLNICAGSAVKGSEITDLLAELTGYSPKIEVNPEFLRKNEIMRMVGDPTKCFDFAGEDLRPISIRQILSRMI